MGQFNLRVLGICIKGFKGFKEEVIFKFPSMQTLIEGRNAQGKTTIGDAISWALYGNDINNSDKDSDLINDQSEEMYVTVEIEIDGKILRITRIKKNVITLKLNGTRITQKALNDYLPNKKLFMTIFNPNNFLNKNPNKAREELLSILPSISPEEILIKKNCLDKLDIINKYANINLGIQGLTKKITATKNNINVKIGEKNTLQNLLDESKLKIIVPTPISLENEKNIKLLEEDLNKINNNNAKLLDKQEVSIKIRETELEISLEQNKYYNSSNSDTIKEMESEVSNLKGQYTVLKMSLDKLYSYGPTCNECGQSIGDEFKLSQERHYKSQMQEIVDTANQYKEAIEMMKSIDIDYQKEFDENKKVIINSLTDRKLELIEQLNDIDKINSSIMEEYNKSTMSKKEKIVNELNRLNSLNDKYKSELLERDHTNRNIEIYTNKLKDVIDEKERLSKEVMALDIEKMTLTEYNIMYVEYITEILSLWLTEVSIELYKVNKDTGELKEDFRVLYKGTKYNRLSNSERVRVGLELSNMFNMCLGIEYPIFVDNAECIIDLPIINTQMIIAKVVNKDIGIVEYIGKKVESSVTNTEEIYTIEDDKVVENKNVINNNSLIKEVDPGFNDAGEDNILYTSMEQQSLLG